MSLLQGDLTYAVIGAAMEVHSKMGTGFLESVYENCLVQELERLDFQVQRQKQIQVFYKGEEVGRFVADLVINNSLIIELKAVNQLSRKHAAQVINYLVATGIEVGLLLNFGASSLQHRRLIHQPTKQPHKLKRRQ